MGKTKVIQLSDVQRLELKYEWLAAEDYESQGQLQYAVSLALAAFGKSLKIKFSGFKHSSV